MIKNDSAFDFSVFGKVDLKALFEEWKEDEEAADYPEPLDNWHLKHGYVYVNGICALLFENTSEESVTFYRVLFYYGENDSFDLVRKMRFFEPDSFQVDAIGIDDDLAAIFICRSNQSVKNDIYFNRYVEEDLAIERFEDLPQFVLEQSDEKFAVVDGMTVLFIKTSDITWVERIDDDPYDFLERFSDAKREKDARAEQEKSDQAGDANSDENEDDEDEDIDSDGEGDDTACHVQAREAASTDKTAQEELHELIGLDDIKQRIDQIVAFANIQKLAKEQGRSIENINLNLSFLGNPGTAKTTVARLFARIMKENGILSKGDLIEVGRADLVAKYTGQTAIKVKGVFEKAKGNILFIDEAYSLVDSWENEYGDEAIATMVQEMENHRDDMIVIFAGYPDKMEKFLSRNPGLRSRVPYVVEFKDYSAEELTAIAKMEARHRGYTISEAAEKRILEICTSALKAKEFGNGRFSRNLVESAIMKAACRTMENKAADIDLDTIFGLEDCDFEMPDCVKKEKQVRVIGFCAA